MNRKFTEEVNLLPNAFSIPAEIKPEHIEAIIQTFPDGTCSVIYFGEGKPPDVFGKISDIYIDTSEEGRGDLYQNKDQKWNLIMNIRGPVGPDGASGTAPTIDTETQNWVVEGVDTGIRAIGFDGATPEIGENGHWFIKGKDTNVVARGTNGLNGLPGATGMPGAPGVTPHIGDNKNWWIGEIDTGIYAEGQDGITPHIGDNNHWFVGDEDTGILARGQDGITPHIGDNNHWFVGDEDTGILARGQDGADGAPGRDGINGVDGAPGVTPYINPIDNHWYIGNEDTGILAAGLKGDKGDKGDKGERGTDGITPTVNGDGNWQIGDEDTGIPATGPQGPKGERGTNGNPGADGAPGRDGINGVDGISPTIGSNNHWYIGSQDTGVSATGPKGDTGARGATGATGAQGPQGPKGDKGDTGARGATGATGAQGPQGPKGDKGDKGARGATGPQGPAGPKGATGDAATAIGGSTWDVGTANTVDTWLLVMNSTKVQHRDVGTLPFLKLTGGNVTGCLDLRTNFNDWFAIKVADGKAITWGDNTNNRPMMAMAKPGTNGQLQLYINGWDTSDQLTAGLFLGHTNNNENPSIWPRTNNKWDIGYSGNRFNNIYASSGTINTSDENLKHDIKKLNDELTKRFVMGLNPVSYVFNDNTSGRTHYGLISQHVEILLEELGLSSKDFAGFIKSPKTETITIMTDTSESETFNRTIENEYIYSLRYEEFIAPLIKMVQMQEAKIEAQQEKIDDLEKRLQKLEELLL